MTSSLSRRERILERLREWGADGPKRSLGQNFLVADHVVEKILFAARSEPYSAIVEVGPGLGALTEDLLTLEKPLTLIELDRRFSVAWRAREGVRVFEADALKLDWRELDLPARSLFVSNLPYQISSSLVIERSLSPAGVTRMILMFQKEVAQRIAAQAGTKEYGLLTVMAQAFWETQTVCDAGPRDFFPPPNVSSRVLQFRERKDSMPMEAREGFLKFVKAAFSHRRKLLFRNLESASFDGLERAFTALGLDPRTARAEELDPVRFNGLYQALQERHV